MMRPIRLLTVAATLVGAGTVAFAVSQDPKGSLTCVHPLDATGIDRVLTEAGSPLAGNGEVFVNAAASVGIDPRALLAIAGHETIFETYAPAQAIKNPFGIGPGRAFATEAAAIKYAADLLSRNYLGQGRRTLSEISGKWAPIGVANDPTNLNSNWVAGVGTLYARLGGDPNAAITLDQQPPRDCATPPPAPEQAAPSQTAPPAVGIVAWNGTAPRITEPLMTVGADPFTGDAATLTRFVFPVAQTGTPIRYTDDFAQRGTPPGCYGKPMRCGVTLVAEVGVPIVAAVGGVLEPSDPASTAGGIAFWIATPDGDRFGYSGLASYQPEVAAGTTVAEGQILGTSTGRTRVAWERSGSRINPYPLLSVTRTSDP